MACHPLQLGQLDLPRPDLFSALARRSGPPLLTGTGAGTACDNRVEPSGCASLGGGQRQPSIPGWTSGLYPRTIASGRILASFLPHAMYAAGFLGPPSRQTA